MVGRGALGLLATAAIAVMATAAVSIVWSQLRHDQGSQWKPSVPPALQPAFILCENDPGQPCKGGPPPVRWPFDFYRPVCEHAKRVAAAGRTPVVVHVGANDFGDDVAEYRPLLAAVKQCTGSPVRMVLVEPNSDNRPVLLTRYRDLRLPERDVKVVTAAMNRQCNGSNVMYAFSKRLAEDFVPAAQQWLRRPMLIATNSWRSFSKEKLPSIVRQVARGLDLEDEKAPPARSFFHLHIKPVVKRVYAAGNCTEYIEEEEVACLTASALSREAQFRPDDVVYLKVDAEGFDAPIMESFVSLPSLRPTLIEWEGRSADHGARGVVDFWRGQGYQMGETENGHDPNVVMYNGPGV